MKRRQRLYLAAVFGVGCLVLPSLAGGADDCARQCRREAVDCVATRCAGLGGDLRRSCRQTCRGLAGCARLRTLAYVVTECRTTAQGSAARQRLMIRRGNCSPTTVMELPFENPRPDGIGLCRLFGESRLGVGSVLAGAFQRLLVSPDGRAVVFEVADEVTLLPSLTRVSPDVRGIYWVKADGTGLRRLGPASRYPRWIAIPDPEGPLFGLRPVVGLQARISPDGRLVAYSDLGPGPDGEEAPQVFVLEVPTGVRRQLTNLAKPIPSSGFEVICCNFLTNTRIRFKVAGSEGKLRAFVVSADGSDLRELPAATLIPGAGVVEDYRIVARRGVSPFTLDLQDGSVEAAVRFGNDRLLQLTNFGSPDTEAQDISPNGRRVYILSSADPVGTNPSRSCQIFSIGTLGTDLRQLTHFREAEQATGGCGSWIRPGGGCTIDLTFLDAKTGELVFYSTCDPFGTNPAGGQMFAMRSDGSGLRQLTSTRGLVVDDDGSVTAELPGPYWYVSRW